MAVQMTLFPGDEDKTEVITIQTYSSIDRHGKRKYHATIGDGWWVVTTNTPKAAIKQIVKRYEQERDGLF